MTDIDALVDGVESEKIGALGIGYCRGRRRYCARRQKNRYHLQPQLVLSPSVPQCHHDTAHGHSTQKKADREHGTAAA